MVPDVTPLRPRDLATGTLHDEHRADVRTVGERPVGIVLQRDPLAAPQALVGGDDGAAVGVENAVLERLRGEAAEHHGVRRADPGARQHGVGGLGNHGHVDAYPVSLADAVASEGVGEPAHGFVQVAVCDGQVLGRVVSLPDDRRLVGPRRQMAVDAVGARVQGRPLEPSHVAARQIPLRHDAPSRQPVEPLAGFPRPECVRVLYRSTIEILIGGLVEVRPALQGLRDGVDGRHVRASCNGRRKPEANSFAETELRGNSNASWACRLARAPPVRPCAAPRGVRRSRNRNRSARRRPVR